MNEVTRATVFAVALAYSSLGITQPTVELIWSSTDGSGTPGSSEIIADVGDYLTLEVYVTGDDEGLLSAAIPLAWDAPDLTAYNAYDNCASGCAGGNGSNASTLFVAFPGGVTIAPGSAEEFDAIGYDTLTGFPSVGYFNDTLLLGRISFYVEASAMTEDIVVDYSNTGGVSDSNQDSWQPSASATIKPPGCG